MDCPSCGHLNREGARFCAECAAPLTASVTCRSCGAANSSAAKHCDSCGQTLAVAEPAPPIGDAPTVSDLRAHPPEHLAEKIRAGRAALEGERKQVTVMFVDIVGSMDLAEVLDPERWRGALDRFFVIACEAVHGVEGTIHQFTGDGVMALFGAPLAHEDHARRGCLAALSLHSALAPLAQELAAEKVEFAIRAGLSSGEVIVGEIGDEGRMDYAAIGHKVGLAQRMESLAAAGSTALSAATAALVAGEFDLRDLGEFEVKGASVPQRVFELVGKARSRDRVEAARARGGLSPLVGRAREQAALGAALGRAIEGDGQVVALVGEPGVGKSRLAYEFTERCAAQGITVQRTYAHSHAREVPLLPMLELFRAALGVGEDDDAVTARARITERFAALDSSFEEDLPLAFDFLGVPDPERPAPKIDPEARQRQLLSLVRRFVQARSRIETAVTLIEDLQWLDEASAVFLAEFVRVSAGTRTLLLMTYRREYAAEVLRGSHCEQLALRPLDRRAVAELLGNLLGDDRSLDGLSDLIAQRAVGNPFFCEELVAALAESGNLVGERGAYRLGATLQEIVLPASVQATLAARIDRLAEREKQLLQSAAVIGYELPEALLEAVAGLSDEELDGALRSLVQAELLSDGAGEGGVEYVFKHPLTQEVAYRSQLSERRRRVHREVALAIQELYPEKLDERAALVAQHSEAAGETLEAARWHARAATWSGTNDPTQALRHWRKVPELADALPTSKEATGLGLTARISLMTYGWRLGISHEETEALFNEAERMASEAGDVRSRAILLFTYGAARAHCDGELRESAGLTRQAIALAEESGDPALYVGVANPYHLYSIGAYREAVAICDRAIELADGDPTMGAGMFFGCPYAMHHVEKGWYLAELGELEQARRMLENGTKIAHAQGDMEVFGFSHYFSTWRAYFAGEPESALTHARRSLEIAERIGSPFSRAHEWLVLGLAERMQGHWRNAIAAVERSRAIARESRTTVERNALRLTLLGESYLGLGDPARARALVDEGLEVARTQGHVPDQMHASLALARVLPSSVGTAARAEIEAALARTLALAAETGAKAYEPLVHVELAELARQSGDEEGRERELREAHRQFTEIGASGHAARLAPALAIPAS
jgi:class 3 adenylate cyclase/tetratricopeptide (TPR) repeat protein